MSQNHTSKPRAIGLVAKNSVSYVSHVLELNDERRLFVSIVDESRAGELDGVQIDSVITPDEEFGWFDEQHPLIDDDAPAQITYTSGTEGKPKGIVLSHANLADTARRIAAEMAMTSEVREYVGVPATYSFGMGRFRAISAVGGKAYLPPRGFDPLELARMLRDREVNSLSAVPTLLRILLASPDVIGDAGDNLLWLEIGSQFMAADEKRRIRELFPNARIVQHYGLTEASRTTFLSISDAADELLDSVGRPVASVEVQTTTDGRIQIRGPHVAQWRLGPDGLHELCDDDGWLTTNDLGHILDGSLFFDGRADDLINCGGVKISPEALEARIGTMLAGDSGVVVAKVTDAMRGDGILVVTEDASADLAQIRAAASAALKESSIEPGDSLHVRHLSTMPRTATGKPQRRKLTESLDVAEAQRSTAPPASAAKEAQDVAGFYQALFPGHRVRRSDSFDSLGGDSLLYIRFSLDFERRFGPLPPKWELMTIEELDRQISTSKKTMWRRLEMLTLTRAIAMIFIVALHMGTFVYSQNWGAAYFLIMLAGYSIIRFQLPEVNRTGKVSVLFGTIQRVAIPTVLFIAFSQLRTTTFELKPLLLISNFFDPSQYKIAYYYFAEFYIQLLLLAAILFSFRRIRELFQKRPMVSAIALLLIVSGLGHELDVYWDTDYLFRRTPHHYAWAFACGIVMACASDLRGRIIAMTVVTVACLLFWGETSATYWVTGGCALLLFVREIKVPIFVKTIVAEIAAASMFIYLTHYQVHSGTVRILGEERPWLMLGFAIIIGIVYAHMYQWADGKVRMYLANRKFRRQADVPSRVGADGR